MQKFYFARFSCFMQCKRFDSIKIDPHHSKFYEKGYETVCSRPKFDYIVTTAGKYFCFSEIKVNTKVEALRISRVQ